MKIVTISVMKMLMLMMLIALIKMFSMKFITVLFKKITEMFMKAVNNALKTILFVSLPSLTIAIN